jgi:hypothetical protein
VQGKVKERKKNERKKDIKKERIIKEKKSECKSVRERGVKNDSLNVENMNSCIADLRFKTFILIEFCFNWHERNLEALQMNFNS